jgi:O-antigen ligase
MMKRFAAIDHEMVTFDHRNDATGSIRERLEMWRTAARAFAAHPLAGIGIDQFDTYVRGEVAAGRSNAAIGKFNHPHNEYLEAAATGGIPGLLALLLVFALPLRYFARYLRDADDAVATPATAAVALVGLYILCAMTDSVFYRVMSQSFYFFLVLGLAVLVGRHAQDRHGQR